MRCSTLIAASLKWRCNGWTRLSPDAIHHGYVSNTANPREEHINERVHWSVIAKREEQKTPLYDPTNLPQHIPTENVAGLTVEERQLLERDT